MADFHQYLTPPECSRRARLLADRLRQCRVYDVVLYREMRDLTGLDIQKRRRDLLYTALRVLLAEERQVFAPVRGVGMKCLASRDIVSIGQETRAGVGRKVQRTVDKLVCVRQAELEQAEQHLWYAQRGVLAAMQQLTEVEALQKAVHIQGPMPKPIDFRRYKDLFA